MKKLLFEILLLSSLLPVITFAQSTLSTDYPYLHNVVIRVQVGYDLTSKIFQYDYRLITGQENHGNVCVIGLDISRTPQSISYDTLGLKFRSRLIEHYFRKYFPQYSNSIIPIGVSKLPNLHWDASPANNLTMSIGIDTLMPVPGDTVSGIQMMSKALPGIRKFQVMPDFNVYDFFQSIEDTVQTMTIKQMDSIRNSMIYYGLTVGPYAPSEIFNANIVIDTLISYTTQSRFLGWIKDQTTANKYLSYFASAKTSLGQNNITSTRTTLQQVLQDVNVDSTNNLTSEAYALIRYNTEYLLAKLSTPPPTYSLTVSTVGNGSVSLNPNQTKYDSASTVQLSATPQQGGVFSGWSGNLTGTTNPAMLTMNANKSVTATFVDSIWTNKDIGSPALAGSTTIAAGIFTVKGAGADVGGTTDQFQYVYQGLTGDGEIIAKVNSVSNTNTSAKAGVMIRESLNANSRFAFIMQRPDKQVQFDGRTSTGGTVAHISALKGGTTNVKFLRLVRSGNSFSAYYSTSSATGPWTSLGTSTITMTANVQMGLFVTSRNTSALCTAVFSQVALPPVQYTLTTSVVGQGSISLTPSGGKYNIGTNVTVTATASSGWTFSNWSGDITGITNPTAITMNGNKSVTATFIPIPVWTNDGPTTFDGTSTYVDGGTSPGSASNLTVAFFMTAHKLANMGPVDKLPTTGKAGWSIKLRSNRDLWFRIGSDGTKTDVTKTGAYSANTRVHVACTFGSGTAKIYVNGVLVTTKNSVTYTVNNTTTHLRLGIPSVAAITDKFAGVLEQVKIYDQVLTASQISSLAAK